MGSLKMAQARVLLLNVKFVELTQTLNLLELVKENANKTLQTVKKIQHVNLINFVITENAMINVL